MRHHLRLFILLIVLAVLLPVAPAAAAGPQLPVWGSVPSPNRNDMTNTLLGVGIIDAADVWAVGQYNSGVVPTATGRRTLAVHWDGTRWRNVPTPNPSFPGLDLARLSGVSGLGADDVWAVGNSEDFGSARSNTLTEHWDGKAWWIVPSPNPAGQNNANYLADVLARSPADVWAVGGQGQDGAALILRFDGARWRTVPNPCGELSGITEVPGTDTMWAVGYDSCFFDGRRWTRVPTAGFAGFADVSASAPTQVWAVGSEVFCDPFTCYSQSAIQRWTGTRWVAVNHPLAAALNGVYTVAADDAWAVGTNSVGTVIQHWDGTDWSEVPSPDPAGGGGLNHMDGMGADTLWAVGSFYDDDFDERTLTVQAPSTTQGQVIGKTNVGNSPVSWFGPVTGTTFTDESGNYDIPGLPAGTYTLTVTYAFGSCDPETARVVVVANQTTVQDFQVDC